MYKKLANQIAVLLLELAEQRNNSKTDVEVIIYGLELILSSLVNLILVLVVGGIFFGFSNTICFVIFFCPLRQFAGGYHANSYKKCTVGFLILFLIMRSVINYLKNVWCLLGICVSCIGVIIVLAPIDTKNKKLDIQLKKNCRKKVISILCIEVVIVGTFFVLSEFEFLEATTTSLLIESILLCLGKIFNKKGERIYVNCDL